MSYNATGTLGLYGVAIQIEDFASLTDPVPMSSVALQFLISVYHSSSNCSTQPVFSTLTRADKSCVGISWNTTYKDRLIATSGSAEEM